MKRDLGDDQRGPDLGRDAGNVPQSVDREQPPDRPLASLAAQQADQNARPQQRRRRDRRAATAASQAGGQAGDEIGQDGFDGQESTAKVIVVLPTYNEAGNVIAIIEALLSLSEPRLQILIVDDNSPDGTAGLVESVARRNKGRVHLLSRKKKGDLGTAYIAGMQEAMRRGAEYIAQMDADFSHDPKYIETMLKVAEAYGSDAVIGSRYVVGGSLDVEWGLHRKLLSKWANFYVQALLGMNIRDATSGLKLWRSSQLRKIDLSSLSSRGYSFQVEMNYRAILTGAKLIEIPIHFRDRREGVSKMHLRNQLGSALMPLVLRLKNRQPPGRRRDHNDGY